MKSPFLVLFFLLLFFFLVDLYVARGVKTLYSSLSQDSFARYAVWVHWLFFGVTVVAYLIAFSGIFSFKNHENYRFFYFLFGLTLLFYIPKLFFGLFMLVDDVWWVLRKLYHVSGLSSFSRSEPYRPDRLAFLYRIGAVTAAVPFAAAAYGMLKGRWDFRVVNETLVSSKIPEAFNGFKVVQFSDAHLGSFFNNIKPVEEALKIMNSLEPDIIVFTGDMVNNYAAEAEKWIPYFKKLKAKHGKYAVLGNHDYGGYGQYSSADGKERNFDRLIEIISEMDFQLLRNEHAVIEKNQQRIDLLGVENWGIKPFPQLGDVNKAKAGSSSPFKILLSHDPSHWDAEILPRHRDIDLTLSGHTHGAQFGVELGNIKWSPVKYKYERWGGMYTEGEQKLYVNRGFGYIGFPGRVGMPPEITCFTLRST